MKYSQFVKAYNVIQKFANMNFNVRDAYKIYNLMKTIEPIAKFGMEREKALIEKYHGVAGQNGDIRFWDENSSTEEEKDIGAKNMSGFIQEIYEMNEMEMDQEITPITLSYDSVGDQKISPSDIAALDGIIAFE